jgi:hypothetical protein
VWLVIVTSNPEPLTLKVRLVKGLCSFEYTFSSNLWSPFLME